MDAGVRAVVAEGSRTSSELAKCHGHDAVVITKFAKELRTLGTFQGATWIICRDLYTSSVRGGIARSMEIF